MDRTTDPMEMTQIPGRRYSMGVYQFRTDGGGGGLIRTPENQGGNHFFFTGSRRNSLSKKWGGDVIGLGE